VSGLRSGTPGAILPCRTLVARFPVVRSDQIVELRPIYLDANKFLPREYIIDFTWDVEQYTG